MSKYRYPAEKFQQARRTLMAPHPCGEDESFYRAFELCSRALRRIDESDLDLSARHWLDQIKDAIDVTGIAADDGKWLVKAQQMSSAEKQDFSNAADELANWFEAAYQQSLTP